MKQLWGEGFADIGFSLRLQDISTGVACVAVVAVVAIVVAVES